MIAARSPHPRPRLKLHSPPPPGPIRSAARYHIGGWLAEVTVWTADEWRSLGDPPADALSLANGCRVVLRMVE